MEQVKTVYVVKEASTPGELELQLNSLVDAGYEVWAIYDRMLSWVIVAYEDAEEDEE